MVGKQIQPVYQLCMEASHPMRKSSCLLPGNSHQANGIGGGFRRSPHRKKRCCQCTKHTAGAGQSGEDGSSVVAQQHSLTAYDHIRPSGDQNDCIGSHRQIMEEADAILQVVLTELILLTGIDAGGVGAATAEGQNLRNCLLYTSPSPRDRG